MGEAFDPVGFLKQDPDFPRRVKEMAQDLQSHTLPRPSLLFRIAALGTAEERIKLQVAVQLALFQSHAGRKLEHEERDRLANHVITRSSTEAWENVAFPLVGSLTYSWVGRMSKNPRSTRTLFAKGVGFLISGLIAEGFVHSFARVRMAVAVGNDPRLEQYNKDFQKQIHRQTLASRQRPPLSSPFPASRPEDDSDQPSWPQTIQDQDPFGNRPPQPSTTTQDAPTWQDDPISDEIEGRTTAAPAPGSSWDRLRAVNNNAAAPGQQQPTTNNTPQTWADRRRAALEKNIADKGGDPAASYASHDEEGARAQAQAQREFDEMLERERRAAEDRDNSGGSAGGKRW